MPIPVSNNSAIMSNSMAPSAAMGANAASSVSSAVPTPVYSYTPYERFVLCADAGTYRGMQQGLDTQGLSQVQSNHVTPPTADAPNVELSSYEMQLLSLNPDQVRVWLHSTGRPSLQHVFSQFDGASLAALLNIYSVDGPHRFTRLLLDNGTSLADSLAALTHIRKLAAEISRNSASSSSSSGSVAGVNPSQSSNQNNMTMNVNSHNMNANVNESGVDASQIAMMNMGMAGMNISMAGLNMNNNMGQMQAQQAQAQQPQLQRLSSFSSSSSSSNLIGISQQQPVSQNLNTMMNPTASMTSSPSPSFPTSSSHSAFVGPNNAASSFGSSAVYPPNTSSTMPPVTSPFDPNAATTFSAYSFSPSTSHPQTHTLPDVKVKLEPSNSSSSSSSSSSAFSSSSPMRLAPTDAVLDDDRQVLTSRRSNVAQSSPFPTSIASE